MQFHVKVDTKDWGIEFGALVWASRSRADRLIEREFYKTYCPPGPIHDEYHHELELDYTPWLPLEPKPIHIHKNPHTGRNFVCWIGYLPTLETAEILFELWCVGTAYTLLTGLDFVPLYHGKSDDFLREMEREHNIKVIEIMWGNNVTPLGWIEHLSPNRKKSS